ncbi:glutaredoxin-related protein 5, mitochondrial-like [Salmo salar]|uniref:Glutaredoxin-related protein 5, mitochondrial n=1 Tax=Salmo salar TaxID=8030 RepID=A0A1S3MAX9_SALSA|nr:glutaredoxin-related protein 5, mitochondrial-like [Salmo salar]|eukprot:XP_014000348.1 PREDICTED: glutaredoxin-related protein 5, mitochondrial-like [Salmo salar]
MNNLIRLTVRCFRLSSSVYLPRKVDGQNVSLPTLKSSARFMCSAPLQTDLGDMVKKDKVVVFMKGTPAQPMCGFSNAVVQILRMHGVNEYAAYNVLDDQDLRQGVKDFSNWPTIPQIFLNGEFVGGCDIFLQMHQNGDLVEELQKLGIRSALLDAEKESK